MGLLGDAGRRLRLAEAARRVAAADDWEGIVQRFEQQLARALAP